MDFIETTRRFGASFAQQESITRNGPHSINLNPTSDVHQLPPDHRSIDSPPISPIASPKTHTHLHIHIQRQRPRPSAPPYSLELISFISHGRLSDAYRSALTLFHTPSSTTRTKWSCVTKVVDIATFPLESEDGYTYAAVAARRAVKNEWEMFETHLRSVQGEVVPRMYGSWICAESGEDPVWIMCMEDAGEMMTDRPEELDRDQKYVKAFWLLLAVLFINPSSLLTILPLPSHDPIRILCACSLAPRSTLSASAPLAHPETHRQIILDLYSSIHALGIVHLDVQPRHIRYNHETGKGPYLIDFEGAKRVAPDSKLFQQEMDGVKAMLEGYRFE